MSSHPLAEDYLRWLESQVRDPEDSQHWDLLILMYEKEFEQDWLVPNDQNRIQDGLDLRVEFCHAQHIRVGALADLGACSFLEVLVGISRRLAFAAGGDAAGWAWQLILNLGFRGYSDPLSRHKRKRVLEAMDTCIQRTYSPDGEGGFFPLGWPDEDQTRIEIWYQMSAYIDEIHPEHR